MKDSDDRVHLLLRKEIDAIYEEFSHMSKEDDLTMYLPLLDLVFTHGKGNVQLHSLELILRTSLGGRWDDDDDDYLRARSMTADRNLSNLTQLVNELHKTHGTGCEVERCLCSVNTVLSDASLIDRQRLEEQNIDTVLDWLEGNLLDLDNENLLSSFFIFLNTYWKFLMEKDNETYQRLRELHKKLLHGNKKYAKIKAFERLNSNFFSSSYQPIR